ncbi:UNVERIFIED_CONTAM: hypothetical protein FKN15_059684 [Acipenser sinensis]
MTTAEDTRKLKDWFLENAGLEAQSLPMVVRALWMMDSERWEAYQGEHTPNTLEEGVELVLSYLEAAIITTAAQVAGPQAEEECLLSPSPPAEGECLLSPSPPAEGECLLSPCPPAEGECLLVLPPQPKREAQKNKEVKDWEEECRLRARHPRRCNKPLLGCLLCDQDHLFAHCPFRSYGEEPERPQPKGEEPERPTPEWEEPERPTPEWEEPERPTPEWEEPERPTPEWEEPERPTPEWEEPERPTPEWEEPERPTPEWEEPERPTPEWEEPERPTPEWGEPERPQPKRGESVRPQPKREESVHLQPKREESVHSQPKEGGVGATIAQEGEGGACTALGPKLPAEGECLLVPPPPAEGECLLSPCAPAEDECLLSPSPPAEGECLLGPRPPAEDECLLVSLPPPSPTPAREGDKPQSPARKAEPHQSPAREAEQHQSPAKGGDYTLLPPPSTGDYTLLPPSSPGDHTLLPPPLLPPQEPEGEELQAQPPEIFWGGEGQDAGGPQQPLFMLLKAPRRAPARPPQQREPASPQPPSEVEELDSSALPGKLKLWCFQFGLLPRLLWPLTVYEVSLTTVEKLEALISSYIRKWLGVPRCLSRVGLYGKGILQLPVSALTEEFKCAKSITLLLVYSDSDVFSQQSITLLFVTSFVGDFNWMIRDRAVTFWFFFSRQSVTLLFVTSFVGDFNTHITVL